MSPQDVKKEGCPTLPGESGSLHQWQCISFPLPHFPYRFHPWVQGKYSLHPIYHSATW